MWGRLIALVKKELLVILRDKRSRILLIVPPLMQLILFSYAATLDVSNVSIAVLNRDNGLWSAELIQRIQGARTFTRIIPLHDVSEIQDAIDNYKALLALHIGPEFSRDVEAGRPAQVQLILDGRRSNAAQIVSGYVNEIVAGMGADLAVRQGAPPPRDSVVERYWFNPSLEFIWFTVPNLIGTIALLVALMVTGQSVARER